MAPRLLGWLALALLLLAAGIARAEPFHAAQTLDQEQAARVVTVALGFMAPRILEPVPAAQLAAWGLRGLTTLDPRLELEWQDGTIRLTRREADGSAAAVAALATPAGQDAGAWGKLAAAALRAGWDASRAVRQAGGGELVRTFFDELFNHLDPYSRYTSPAEAGEARDARAGRAGVGLALAARGRRLVVAAVSADGPASAAGVRVGDAVLAIDATPVDGEARPAAEAMLAGAEDDVVELALRTRDDAPRTVSLRRVAVPPETVRAARAGPLLVLRISAFAADTGARLAHALAGALRPGVRGVVLDLRGNRGGVLAQAVAAAEAFLQVGVVATVAGRDPEAQRVFRADADGQDRARGLPVVVLVDGRSASAAEVLAAALADQHRAVVVGSATVGKGLVQTIAPLPDGGSLYVTWGRVLAPLGWPLQGLGVLPQVCTAFGQDAAMRQLRLLAAGTQPMQATLARARMSRAPLPAAEALEIRQACPAAEGRDPDLAAARYLVDHPAAYAAALLGPPP